MKILLVGRASPKIGGKSVGGIAKHIEDLSVNLKQATHIPAVFDFTLHSNKVSNDFAIEVYGVSFATKIINTLSFFIFSLSHFQILRKYCWKDIVKLAMQLRSLNKAVLNYDVIHVHSLHDPVAFFIKLKANTKLVVTDHGFWQSADLLGKEVSKILFKLKQNIKVANQVIYISEYAKGQLELFKLFEDKMVKIPNPVSVDLATVQLSDSFNVSDLVGYHGTEKLLFFNGYSESVKRKGLDILLKAYSHSNSLQNECMILAICDNEGMELINSRYSNLKVYGVPAQSWDTICNLYTICNCLVVPSKSESFGLIYIEALTFGKPVVGFDKVLEEFENRTSTCIGARYSPQDDDEITLSRKIEGVVFTDWNQEKLSNAAIFFSWEKGIKEFLSLYGK